MKHLLVASLLLACLLLNLTACQKEQQPTDLPDNPTPIDTTTVTPIDTTSVDTTHTGPQYLPASVMAADTGAYGRVENALSNGGQQPRFYYWEQRLSIQNDTLLFGNWRLLPTSSKVAYIRPTVGTVAVPQTSSTGYTYYNYLPCTTDGYVTVEEKGLRVEYYHHLDAGGIRYTNQFFYTTRNSAPLTRSDYLGAFTGAITDANGYGQFQTLHIEADSTTNGVWLPEIQRQGFVNEAGELVLPESPVEPNSPNNPAVFSTATATLRGQVLVFGVQALDYPGAAPIAGEYKRYLFVKN